MAEKDPVDVLMHAFNEFKSANDENLKKRDALLEAKIENTSKALDRFEDVNQKLILAEQQAKATQEQLERIEELINRPSASVTKQDFSAVTKAFDRVMRRSPQERDRNDVETINKYANIIVKADDVSAGYLLAPPEMEAAILKNLV